MFDSKTIRKESERKIETLYTQEYLINIEHRFWGRLRFFSWGVIAWMIGELILIMATIGAAEISLVLSSNPWKATLMILLLTASVIWGVMIPLWYTFTSLAIFIGLIISTVEEYILKKYPLKFTNRPLFGKLDCEIFEEYL